MAFAAGAFAIADDRKRNADSRESRANAANPVAQRHCRSADANILFAKRVSTGADDANEFSYPMIPREILKKIRQIELRTNRIVTETLSGFSFQPSPQFRRIPRAMPDSQNFDFAMLGVDGEVNRVRPRRRNFGFPGSWGSAKKPFGLVSEGV